MRILIAIASAALVLTAVDGAHAGAEPAAPPEVPTGGRLVFADNPAIADPHPMPIESWSRVAGEDAVAVNFTAGTPECNGVHATVAETADSVTVALQGGTLSEAAGRMCIMLAVFGTLDVPLRAPLGDRRVLSAA